MKTTALLITLLLFRSMAGSAQVTAVLIGVNGLTCSQCTRNVEMQLRKLSFVSGVKMNLQHTNGTIQLKDAAGFAPERIAKSVQDAGFSLRYLKIAVAHAGQYRTGEGCFAIPGLGLQVAGDVPASLPEPLYLQLLGEPFQPRKNAGSLPKKTCAGSRYFVTITQPDQS